MNNINVSYALLEYFKAQSLDHDLHYLRTHRKWTGVFSSLILFEGQMQLATTKIDIYSFLLQDRDNMMWHE